MTNRRFEELERRCSKLKKARILRLVFIIGSLFLAGFSSYYWTNHSHISIVVEPVPASEPIATVTEVQPIVRDQNESNSTLTEKTIVPKIVPEEILFLAPQLFKKDAKLSTAETKEATKLLSQEGQLLKNYNTVQNFENAYALAHFYFERQSYSDVIIWVKETSKHDSRSEKPWILYAKAKFLLGDRAEAIRSLELFLSYINSKEAHELLNFYKGQE